MKIGEKGIRWLEAELIVVLAVVLLLGVLFGYSLATSRFAQTTAPGAEEPAPANFGVGGDEGVELR